VDLTIVICALAFAALTAAAAAIAVWRARATADARVANAVQRVAAGMHETMRDLAGSVEATRQAKPPEQVGGELAASLDVDEVAARTLAAVESIPGVEAAALETPATSASSGMQPDEAGRARIGLPDNDNLRAIEASYRYRLDDAEGASARLRSAVVVPLLADGATIGSLSAFTRTSTRALTESELEEVERIANRAGPALENARRYAEARALADLDALTGLHNRRYFHETLAREIARAQRYGRRLALVVIDLDDFKAVNDRVGHLSGDAVLAEVSERMRTVVRDADIACRVGGDEFGVILPESSAGEAELLAGRIAEAVAARAIPGAGTLRLSAGAAELREGDRPSDLFERADDALYRAKGLGKSRTVLADGASL
jgi:diguanylate cyclase (GGDEF)-like protein